MASQITSFTSFNSAVYSGADQRKHQSSASLVLACFHLMTSSWCEWDKTVFCITPHRSDLNREITKSSSTFSATNISCNVCYVVWLLQLHDTIVMKFNLVAFNSQNENNVWVFDYHSLTCSVRKMVLICLMQNIDMCLLYKSHRMARLVSHLINHFFQWVFTV